MRAYTPEWSEPPTETKWTPNGDKNDVSCLLVFVLCVAGGGGFWKSVPKGPKIFPWIRVIFFFAECQRVNKTKCYFVSQGHCLHVQRTAAVTLFGTCSAVQKTHFWKWNTVPTCITNNFSATDVDKHAQMSILQDDCALLSSSCTSLCISERLSVLSPKAALLRFPLKGHKPQSLQWPSIGEPWRYKPGISVSRY